MTPGAAPPAAPPAATPLTPEDFAARIAPLHSGGPLALAISGGGDSMALMALAAEWAVGRDVPLLALTVDHGLRPDASADAAFVEDQARALGLPARRLEWRGAKPSTGVQAAAREARYRLMAATCREAGIGTLAVAHTLDDQAETVLMRLARGAGVDGLSAMAGATARYELRLIRPLLNVRRATLRATLAARGLPWRDDPTNEDLAFERIRVREALAALEPLGIDAAALARTAARMGEAREALDAAAAGLAGRAATFEPMGYVRFAPAPLTEAPKETALRLLSAAIRWVSGAGYAPGREELERAFDWIASAPASGGRTLHGCQFDAGAGGVTVSREPAAATEIIAAPSEPFSAELLWDGRFRCHVSGVGPESRLAVSALGAEGARQVKAEWRASERWSSAPRAARLSSPALWRGNALVAAPFAGAPPQSGGPGLKVSAIAYPFSLKGPGESLC